jgi:hypothetical protein
MAMVRRSLAPSTIPVVDLLQKAGAREWPIRDPQPCRAQQALYEVKAKYPAGTCRVLNISTDESRVVAPFLERNKWKKMVYFDDGLQRLLNVTSIPTPVVFDKQGEIASRMNGFIPHRFVDMLAERIDQMLAER